MALVTPTASSSRPTAALLAVGLVAPAAVAAPIAAREMSIPGARDPLATALTLQTVALGLASVVLSLELGRILCTAAVAVAAVAAWSGARAHDVRVTTRRGAGITRTGRTRSAVRRTVGIAGAVGLHHLLGGDALVHLATCSAASAVLVVATVGRGSTSVVRCAGHAHDARSVGA